MARDELTDLVHAQAADLVSEWPQRQRTKAAELVVFHLLMYRGTDRRLTRLLGQVVHGEPLTARELALAEAIFELGR